MQQDSSYIILKKYDTLIQEFNRLGGYTADHEIKRVANGLGIPEHQMSQQFDTLSGGEKTRVNLARLILENTDILLLDEPTNHLDMSGAEWLEGYLEHFSGTLIVISHDRYFLDCVAKRTIEISKGKASFYSGNYSFYVAEKERRELEQIKKYEREQSEIKRLQASADRLHQWGTQHEKLIRRSQSIEKRIARIEHTSQPDKNSKINVRFGEKDFRGDDVLVIKGVSKSYGERILFSEVSLTVRNGERIALIGDNGVGKSTLIKMIIGCERPDAGYIRLGPSIKTAYLPQHVEFRDSNATLVDTVMVECKCTAQTARNILGSFRFSGDDVFKRVSDLSGGEQSRLCICILMQSNINFLLLDEPTNHMDIKSREWVEESVEEYGEALLFISHDRYFINRFATRIWEIRDGVLTDYHCNFAEFRAMKTAIEIQSAFQQKDILKPEKKPKAKRPQSTEKRLVKIEHEIEILEETLKKINARSEEFAYDYIKLMEIEEEQIKISNQLEEKYLEWEKLSEIK